MTNKQVIANRIEGIVCLAMAAIATSLSSIIGSRADWDVTSIILAIGASLATLGASLYLWVTWNRHSKGWSWLIMLFVFLWALVLLKL